MQPNIASQSESLDLDMNLEASPVGETGVNHVDKVATFQPHAANTRYQERKISVGGTLVYKM